MNGDASGCATLAPDDVPTNGTSLSSTPGTRATLPAIADDTTFWRGNGCLYVATTGTINDGQVTAYPIDGGTLQIAADVPDETSFTVTWMLPGTTCNAAFVFHGSVGEIEALGGVCI